MFKFKLTNQNLTTYRGFRWEVGKVYRTLGEGNLCGSGWLHGYHHPLLAAFLNPIHANIQNPRMWVVECGGEFKDDYGLKFGCTQMAILEEMKLPEVTLTQRVAFGILAAKEVTTDPKWNDWADKWLSGEDRSEAESAEWMAAAWMEAARAEAAWAAWARAEAAWAAREAANKKPIDLIAIAEKALEYQ